MLVTDRRKSDGHVRCLESQMHSRWVEWSMHGADDARLLVVSEPKYARGARQRTPDAADAASLQRRDRDGQAAAG